MTATLAPLAPLPVVGIAHWHLTADGTQACATLPDRDSAVRALVRCGLTPDAAADVTAVIDMTAADQHGHLYGAHECRCADGSRTMRTSARRLLALLDADAYTGSPLLAASLLKATGHDLDALSTDSAV